MGRSWRIALFGRIFSRDRRGARIADALYGVIVAQAREPALYASMGVPDSVSGRFEMLILHLVLLTRRTETGSAVARAAGQGAFDLFCRDMDNALRDLGIGDLKVPKKMREVGEAYFGRASLYRGALDRGDAAALAAAIERTVFDGEAAGHALPLAEYALDAAARLSRQDEAAILAGSPDFPDAISFVTAGGAQ